MKRDTNNQVITALWDPIFDELLPAFDNVPLRRDQIVEAAGERIQNIYFPETAVLSLTSIIPGDRALDVGMIGFEGLSGISLILGNDVSLYTKIVRIAGTALRLPADKFASALDKSPELRVRLLRYVEALRYQVSTAAAASAHMRLEARLGRAILMLHDRTAGGPIRVTHASLAAMLGATRPAVSSSCITLQERRLLRCGRREIEVLDREGLVALADGSYGLAEAHHQRLHGQSIQQCATSSRDHLLVASGTYSHFQPLRSSR